MDDGDPNNCHCDLSAVLRRQSLHQDGHHGIVTHLSAVDRGKRFGPAVAASCASVTPCRHENTFQSTALWQSGIGICYTLTLPCNRAEEGEFLRRKPHAHHLCFAQLGVPKEPSYPKIRTTELDSWIGKRRPKLPKRVHSREPEIRDGRQTDGIAQTSHLYLPPSRRLGPVFRQRSTRSCSVHLHRPG